MRRGLVIAAAATALLVPGCGGGSGGDKAGGSADTTAETVATPVGEPVTLTLATVDDLWASEFAAVAARLSGGMVRIELRIGGSAVIDYERRLIQDVREGEVELASIGARVWDRMGVNSFRALVAPLLVESLAAEARMLADPLVQQTLHGVEPLGLVGLAVLAGPLRWPLGITRPLLGPRDYAGAAIGIRYGRVPQATLRALGATVKGYRIGSVAGLDGAELDVATIDANRYDVGARALTGNVVLWARPETIVISRRAFDRLPRAQRDILRRAGREAAAPVLARLQKEQRDTLRAVCGRGAVSVVDSSAGDIEALRSAVRPVYEELERDPQTSRLIAEIRAIAGRHEPETLACSDERASAAPQLEGRWRVTASRAEVLAAGATPREDLHDRPSWTIDFDSGRWSASGDGGRRWTGDYSIGGDVVHLTLRTCSHNPCDPGDTAEQRWSVYRDSLTLTAVAGRPSWWRLTAKPFTRVH
jgi:TRAP-type C4-dicarboxylate transport system substrate-binding protein